MSPNAKPIAPRMERENDTSTNPVVQEPFWLGSRGKYEMRTKDPLTGWDVDLLFEGFTQKTKGEGKFT